MISVGQKWVNRAGQVCEVVYVSKVKRTFSVLVVCHPYTDHEHEYRVNAYGEYHGSDRKSARDLVYWMSGSLGVSSENSA